MTNPAVAPHQTEGRLIRWAMPYDLFVHVLTLGRSAQFRERIADLAQPREGDSLLDVGCGTGDLALCLAQRVGPTGCVAGIDAAPEMIARARQKARRRRVALDFRVESVAALSFPDQTFDGVVSSLVFHHLPGDLKHQGLQSIARVLKPGGKMTILDFMNADGHFMGHAGVAVPGPTLTGFLHDLGFIDVTSSPMKFRTLGSGIGMPPLGYVTAQKPTA